MARITKLRPEHALELKAFLTVQADQQKQLSAAVGDGTPVIAASRLLSRFVTILGDRDVARNVLRQLLFIAEYVRSNQCTSRDAFADMVAALGNDTQWTKEEVQIFSSLSDWVVSLADSSPVYGSAKAMTLSYDRDFSFSDFHIITDIRPVFDRARDGIIGAMIMNDLRIEYSDSFDNKSLSLAASLEDLKKIRAAIDDAISKSSRAQRWLETPSPIPSFVSGEESYGFD